ncbi:DUF177 domain-containing protein [bacterium]|nr:DUF177 domain-containing protein [bacterium]
MKRENPFLFFPKQLEQGENRFEIQTDSVHIELAGLSFTEPIRCSIILFLTGARIDMNMDINTRIQLECSQCGGVVDQKIETNAEVTFLQALERNDDEGELKASDLEFYTEELDLRSIVRDTLLLSVPIAPLCREDCLGLCPTCGANLNLGACDCGSEKLQAQQRGESNG